MNWEEVGRKLSSRKFWMSIAAFLGSLAASIAGLSTGNDAVATAGIICGMLSAAIYAASEAWVDGQSVAAKSESKVTTVSANTTSKDVVAALTTNTPIVS